MNYKNIFYNRSNYSHLTYKIYVTLCLVRHGLEKLKMTCILGWMEHVEGPIY